MPSSPQWHPNEILSWNPETDPDAPYNRSMVPLAARLRTPTAQEDAALNSLWNVNPHARPGEARVQAVTTFNTIPAGGTHGWRTTRLYAPSIWQYTDNMVFWGSSDRDTRTILTPTAHMIDAAHRNGVRIYGKIFFHWNSSPDNDALARIRDLVQKSGNTFPVADKLIDAALYYGFDGWFINQENYQTNATDAQNMRDFMAYFRYRASARRASHLKIVWYDAMAENGSRSFQNALTNQNDGFMKSGSLVTQTGDTLAAHEMFLNFWWYYGSSNLTNSRALAFDRGIDPYDLYAGIWTENYRTLGYTPEPDGGGNISIPWDYLFPENRPHNLSVALFGAETPFVKGSSPAEVVEQDQLYWSGPNQDPSNTDAAGSATPNWNGLAHYVAANSPIVEVPFVTNFNLGQGDRYFIDGHERMTGPWTNLSLQDILPTWRWIVETEGTELTPSFDYEEAYYGGSSLLLEGSLSADLPNDIKLYQTNLLVEEETRVRLIYKPGAVNDSTIQVGFVFKDDPSAVVYSDPAPANSDSWSTLDFSLASYAGREIVELSLRVSIPGRGRSYSANIGRLEIFNGAATAPAAPSELNVEEIDRNPDAASSTQLRLKWTPSPDPVLHYNVYYRRSLGESSEGERVWVGATPNHYFFAQDVRPVFFETEGYIEVEAVGSDYGVSSALSTVGPTFAFEPPPNLHYPVIGSYPAPDVMILGSGTSFDNHARAFDNDINTFAEPGGANGAWVGLDLGSRTPQQIVAIQFVPRNNWSSRMINGVFQGSNTAAFSSGVVELARINASPPQGTWTTLWVDEPTAFRYVRYLSPSGGYANVAEIKFYRAGERIAPNPPTDLGAAVSGTTATLNWESSTSTIVYGYDVKRSTTSGGPYAVVASGLTGTGFQDPGLVEDVPYYYVVCAVNDAGEGADSAEVVAMNDYTRWLTQSGIDPQEPNAAFDRDRNGNGIENGVEYMVKETLRIEKGLADSRLVAVVRKDPSVTATLWASEDLDLWSEVLLLEADDQGGVAEGFVRVETEEAVDFDMSRSFYRLRFAR